MSDHPEILLEVTTSKPSHYAQRIKPEFNIIYLSIVYMLKEYLKKTYFEQQNGGINIIYPTYAYKQRLTRETRTYCLAELFDERHWLPLQTSLEPVRPTNLA